MFENNISTMYAFSSTLFCFFSPSSHRTIEHCHKHGCYSKCWLGLRKTLQYSLDLLHELLPSYNMWKFTLLGEGREGWQGRSDNIAAGWIHGCRRGKQIDQENWIHRGGGNFTTIVQQQLVLNTHSSSFLYRFQKQTPRSYSEAWLFK